MTDSHAAVGPRQPAETAKNKGPVPKHREIYAFVRDAIMRGNVAAGQRLPSQEDLCNRFGVSRPTVARALRDLEVDGYLECRRGARASVKKPKYENSRSAPPTKGLIGMIVPQFEDSLHAGRVCSSITRYAEEAGHSILLSSGLNTDPKHVTAELETLCQRLIAQHVVGVFFEPLELPTELHSVNQVIARKLSAAGIQVVLLDRDIYTQPLRSEFDLIGVDNLHGGYVITRHLLRNGCKRPWFLTMNNEMIGTIKGRRNGFREALLDHEIEFRPESIQQWQGTDIAGTLRRHLDADQPDGIFCANDHLARQLLHHLSNLGVRVPDDIRVVGFDDCSFAATLPIPLTTMHQPTEQLSQAAVEAMLNRLSNPKQVARHVQLACSLVIRETCGGKPHPETNDDVEPSEVAI